MGYSRWLAGQQNIVWRLVGVFHSVGSNAAIGLR